MADVSRNDILTRVDGAAEQFANVITKTEKAIFDSAVALIKKLDIDSRGHIRTTTANLKLLSDIKLRLGRMTKSKEYLKGVQELVKAFDDIYRAQVSYYSTQFAKKTLTDNAKKKFAAMQRVAVTNTIEGLTGSGVNANVTDELSKMLLRAVTTGAKYSDLVDEFRSKLISSDDNVSAFAKYANTYATTALTQYAGQNNKLFTDDLGTEWFEYVGSQIESTREFCNTLLERHQYIHKSEIKDILAGRITDQKTGEVIEVEINAKTGLPKGMIEGTTPDNFQVNVGGWNCRHQLVPIAKEAVPKEIRERYECKPQQEDQISEWEDWYYGYKSYIDKLVRNAAICDIDTSALFDKTQTRSWYMREYVKIESAVNKERDMYNAVLKKVMDLSIVAQTVSGDLASEITQFAVQHQFEKIGRGQFNSKYHSLVSGYANYKNAIQNASNNIDAPLTSDEIANGCIAPTVAQKQALLDIAKKIGIELQRSMTREQADTGRENPNYSKGGQYLVNCQTCTMVHLARRLGLNVEAIGNYKNSVYKYMQQKGMTWLQRFLNADGTTAKYEKISSWAYANGRSKITKNAIAEFIETKTQADGIYEIYCQWKGGSAHVFCVERTNGKLRYFDPQPGVEGARVEQYIERMVGKSVMLIRMDDKIINPKCYGLFVKK